MVEVCEQCGGKVGRDKKKYDGMTFCGGRCLNSYKRLIGTAEEELDKTNKLNNYY
jgi:hypothetical protein